MKVRRERRNLREKEEEKRKSKVMANTLIRGRLRRPIYGDMFVIGNKTVAVMN